MTQVSHMSLTSLSSELHSCTATALKLSQVKCFAYLGLDKDKLAENCLTLRDDITVV